jgi:hypothetical protein
MRQVVDFRKVLRTRDKKTKGNERYEYVESKKVNVENKTIKSGLCRGKLDVKHEHNQQQNRI